MKKYTSILFMALLAAGAVSCAKGDRFNPNKEVVIMTGTDKSPLTTLAVEEVGATYPISVSSTGKVGEDVMVTVNISKADLDKYNAANGTKYEMVPTDAIAIDGNAGTTSANMKIAKGNASSTAAALSIAKLDFFESGVTYAIPVSITKVNGNYGVLESSRTMIIKLSRVIIFKAFSTGNPDMSSNFIWEEGKRIPLNNYTYEIKFWTPNLLTNSGDNPTRFCAFEQADESKAMLLRFNEASNDPSESKRTCRRLQIINPNDATLISNTKFDDKKWYMLTLTFDGSNVRFYVNGEEDNSSSASAKDFVFGRFEMGMSWGGGYRRSQFCDARICEMRVWNRALSATEIKNGLCGVPNNSEGLQGYWKFDEGEGHIFHDSTGNGRDMDWSNTSRDNGNGTMTPTPEAGEMADERWINDPENNRCVN